VLTGGAIYATPTSNWFVSTPAAPNYGTLPDYGVGPYQQEWTPFFEPASTLLGALYDIAQGVDPNTGEILAPYGTTGTLKFGAGTMWMDPIQEQIDTGFLPGNPLAFGYVAPNNARPGNPWPQIPSGYLTQSPKRLNERPSWLQWYESIQ
jgi:hypothetical protein